jgi:hypothetical protein
MAIGSVNHDTMNIVVHAVEVNEHDTVICAEEHIAM